MSGFFYKSEQLLHIAHEEGRALKLGDYFRYEFNLTDHLGNVRVSFSDVDYDGAIEEAEGEVLQVDHYYPFGMRMGGLSYNSGTENRYRYNGKEFHQELGLGLYDYGARYYDPSIGRWNGVDALAEDPNQLEYSPYAYTWNNPINLTDPDGNFPCTGCKKWLRKARDYAADQVGDSKVGQFLVGVADVAIELIPDPAAMASDALERGGNLAEGISTGNTEQILDNAPITGEVRATANMVEAAAEGDPRAIGQVVGTVATAVAGGKTGLTKGTPKTTTALAEGTSTARGAANPKVAAAIAKGRQAHAEFSQKAASKGWQVEPRLTDPQTGKTVIPDAVTKSGHPVELKPNTPSGRAQLPKYERATGQNGRVIYYDPKKY